MSNPPIFLEIRMASASLALEVFDAPSNHTTLPVAPGLVLVLLN